MEKMIKHDKSAQKFYITLNDHNSELTYSTSADGKTLNFKRTFVPEEHRGKKIASSLVQFALEYAKENNYKVIPTCSFVKWYIEQNPEFESLKANI